MKLNSIPIEHILSNVKMTLRSFDDAGLLNDSELMRHSDWVVNRLGMGMMEEIPLVLDVENYKAPVPHNLKLIDFVYRCSMKENQGTHVKYYFGNPHTFTVQDYSKKICYNKCHIEEDITEITRTIVIDTVEHKTKYSDKALLKASKSVPKNRCTKTCPNLRCESPDYFDMDNDNFYFNFESGSVYINYHGTRLDDEGYPLIVDDPYVTRAIEDYLIYRGLQTIYYNSEVDVAQRLQLAKAEHDRSLKEALFNEKLPSYTRLIKYAGLKAKNYEIFNLPSVADAPRKHR